MTTKSKGKAASRKPAAPKKQDPRTTKIYRLENTIKDLQGAIAAYMHGPHNDVPTTLFTAGTTGTYTPAIEKSPNPPRPTNAFGLLQDINKQLCVQHEELGGLAMLINALTGCYSDAPSIAAKEEGTLSERLLGIGETIGNLTKAIVILKSQLETELQG